MDIKFVKEYTYDDIILIPKKCIVKSRSECDTTVKLGNFTFISPVIAANMKSVVDKETCKFFAKKGWFYIMHRFEQTKEDYINFIADMRNNLLVSSVSIGVKKDDYDILKYLYINKIYPDFITIDIAHGHSDAVSDMIKYIKDNFVNTFVIAGNVCTSDAVQFLELAGADCIKIGLSFGKSCTTRFKTGFGRAMVNTILESCDATQKTIIADGGITYHGDITKAITLGADMVMCGSLFSGYLQSAGEILEIDNHLKKEYYGSASVYNKTNQKHIEGKRILVDYKGDMQLLLNELIEDLQSSISYAGGNKLKDLRYVDIVCINK